MKIGSVCFLCVRLDTNVDQITMNVDVISLAIFMADW